MMKISVKAYYRLAKPGIIYGNVMNATGGFLLAAKGDVNGWLMLATLSGLALIIGSACVFNNYIDRDLDKKMKRTQKRALVTKEVSAEHAIIYATALGLAGTWLLVVFANWLATGLALFGFFAYVVLYGIGKRRTVHGTVVGSISGAMPPVVGYCAVSNQLDSAALLLFLILVAWQMPHFYAIAMYRFDDYKSAKLPVLPVKKGLPATKLQILAYILAFIIATSLLSIFGYTGYTYLLVVGALGLVWLARGIQGFKTTDDARWARKMFGFSLIVITVFSLMLSITAYLP